MKRSGPDPERIAALREEARREREARGLPPVDDKLPERRAMPTPMEVALAQARVDGWHGTREREHIGARIGREPYRKAWREGQAAKARGEPCRCIRCWSGEVDV